ncbi:MAG: UDP-N-acetylmuramoyl-tripeptide--D-alanyl-D-alanine ligase [Actinomycetota bacterium]
MRPRSLSEIARAVDGSLHGDDTAASSVVIDSRLAGPGALFVALAGEHADGHAFVGDALSRGAAGAVVERQPADEGPTIVVRDTGRALLALAADERRAMTGVTLIAITGANGKTSTKDLAASVLSTRMPTHASPASFNNEIGLPLTLLGAPADSEVIVAEMGARREGDVAALCQVASPDIVVVTNLGVAHMEIFGSWDAIVRSGAEPLAALGPDDVAILNADDPVVAGFASRARARVRTFGVSGGDVRAEDITLDEDGRASFTLAVGDEREHVELAVPGEHMVSNALAAAACGAELAISAAECAAALKGAQVSRWRMETFTTSGGVRIVNDAYNANPESMSAGLKAARWMARGSRLAAVLGHMAELGPIALEEHERLGELVVRIGVERLITVGQPAELIARAAIREGALPADVASYGTPEDAVVDLAAWMRPGDVVLVKGSRVAGLERVAETLR